MGKRQFITLRTRNSNEEVDVELPGDQPISSLMSDLIKALNWPQNRGSIALHYHLENEAGDVLDNNRTFSDSGIENFDVLWIVLEETAKESTQKTTKASESTPAPTQHNLSEEENLGNGLPPPFWEGIPIDAPCLVSNAGIVFMLGQPPIVIGRHSQKSIPDVDLSELDIDFISSRQHAEIVLLDGKHTLRALNTMNGMLINGSELQPGDLHRLDDGDVLQFGFRGAQLIFRQPKS